MEYEKHVSQTIMSPQGWEETHTSPDKPVHVGTHHTHIAQEMMFSLVQ